MEHTKGKLKFQKTDCAQIGWLKYRICNSEDTRNIALVDNGANAIEFVRRWNAYEEGGLVEELRTACEESLTSIQEVLNQHGNYDEGGRRIKLPIERTLEAALAKS